MELPPLQAQPLRHQTFTHSARGLAAHMIHGQHMTLLGRRTFVTGAALLPVVLLAPRARATLMRGLSLSALCGQSQHILLARGLESHCVSLPIGGRPMIVTETKLRVEDVLAKVQPTHSEIVVRTLGGVLDGVGELVHGQAEFSLDASCVAFLTRAKDGALWVSGMAQGHYPIASLERSEARLSASPHLPSLRDFEHSAVRSLVGKSLLGARGLIAQESAR